MTPLKDLKKRFAEDYAYKPKPKAKRDRLTATPAMIEGQTVKKEGDIVIVSAHKKGIEL